MTHRSLTRRTPANLASATFLGDDFLGPALLRTFFPEAPRTRSWVPPVDIHESADGYEVIAELPGMTKKDITVTLEDNVLTITGSREQENENTEGTIHRTERTFGSFSRAFTLPSRADVNKVKATFKNGLLTLQIPKAEEARSREIAIS